MLNNFEKSLLYIDDETANLEVFKISFSSLFKVYTTTSPEEAWKILNNEDIQVVISDQRMPEILGLDLLKQVNSTYPHIVTILLTAYSDTDILLDAINRVGVYRYILKPWKGDEIIMTLNNAFEKYALQLEREKLLDDLKKQNEQLKVEKHRAEESARLKAAFLGNISHEIRTPMNGIIGFSELLLQESIDKSSREMYSQLVNVSCKNLLVVLNDIILLSELQAEAYSSEKKECKIEMLIASIEEILKTHQNRINKKHLDKEILNRINISTLKCDEQSILTVLDKVIDNALKFTEKGKIEITLDIEERMGTPTLLIGVADNGIGIPKDKLDLIFEAFYQTEPLEGEINSGNGIGLSIVRAITKLIDGTIDLSSEPGKGTSFLFHFPAKYA